MKLVWSEEARSDAAKILASLAQQSPAHAQRFLAKIENKSKILRRFPLIGRTVPELEEEFPSIRQVLVEDYRLIYQVYRKGIQITSFFHTRQSFPLRAR